ncbi:MAG: molecular chaperone DnaJ [Sorangiineae bacterium NIC37A_2]|jgi:molecular chaperone DnaJ|nr:MAG: molecular chaperone DnaJ [Sorangiineae bacterium NIC37A_2]
MSEKRDFYEVLGVARDASDDDIRRAYRKLALQFHPDRNKGDPSAEAKFKEATEAYTVLSDAQKRAQYDRFGHQGMGAGFDFQGAGVGDIFSHFQDMFSDFFGGFGGGGGGGGQTSRRGQDTRVRATLTLAESMTGTKKEVQIRGAAPCEACEGSGARAGTKPTTCGTCQGSGQVATQRGFIMFSTTCPACRGQGRVISDPCPECRGERYVEKRRKVLVSFPAGIDGGQRLRVPGQGMPGHPGAEPGDLYVDVELEPHPEFERDGFDIGTRRRVSFPDAALGGELTVRLPDDSEIVVKYPAGTQPGTVLTTRGKGIPQLNGRGRGDVHVLVEVEVPEKLSRKARKLIEELREELN